MISKALIAIPCPQCEHKTKKTIAWIKAHHDFACVGCGVTITLDKEGLSAGLAAADKAIAKLNALFLKLGK